MGNRLESFCSYRLLICLKEDAEIQIGKLGKFRFPAGNYVYTGSAKKSLDTRISRHLSRNKKLRWHIDYLLHHPQAVVLSVQRNTEPECALNQKTPGIIVVPGFGSSDCRKGCGSHLKYGGTGESKESLSTKFRL